jgi:probable HAF family extracellular repeat protein
MDRGDVGHWHAITKRSKGEIMRKNLTALITSLSLCGALAFPVMSSAQDQLKHHHYKLIDVSTFGGPQSNVFVAEDNYNPVLNNRGTVAGLADTSAPDPFPAFCFFDCFVSHAFQWQNGDMTDLGALPGGASSASAWISANGLIAGWSENGLIDPLFPGFPESHAVLWKHGEIIDLGTLDGGYESVANAVNSRGQVVGAAANAVPDLSPMSAFNFGWTTETRAFLWQNGVMHDLGTLGGPDAVALLINEWGQIVGDSYTSSVPSPYCANIGFPLTTGAFLWQNGKMVGLGSLGGTCTFAFDLNNRGQVIGASTLAGDLAQHPFLWDRGVLSDLGTLGGSSGNAIAINDAGEITGFANEQGDQTVHALLWKNGTMTDLGTVGGDPCSVGFSINARGQVVGISVAAALPTGCDFSQARAFLSEDGAPPIDLNTLIPANSALYLTTPATINDRGEIAGNGMDSQGNQHAFLLIPCDANHPGIGGCDYTTVDPTTAASFVAPRPVTQTAPASDPPLSGLAGHTMRALRNRLLFMNGHLTAQPLAHTLQNTLATTLSAPHSLTASALDTFQIGVSWQEASGQSLSGFDIYRCVGCATPRTEGTKIASVSATVFAFSDGASTTPLRESEAYTYQVTAFNTSSQSAASNTASAITKTEPAPTNLTSFAFVRGGIDDVVRLSWTNNATDDDSYFVESCTGSTCTNFSVLAQLPANSTSDIQGFQFIHNITVRYRVRAHSPGGYSGYSNIRNQTLP